MIKPDVLWGQFKTCKDDAWIGRVCRALGGQDVELDFGQQSMVTAIKLSAGWMDEAVEARRSKWKQQKRNQRGQFSESSADIADMSTLSADKNLSAGQPKTQQCPPPSILPSNSNNIKEPKDSTAIQEEYPTSEVCESPARTAPTHTHAEELPIVAEDKLDAGDALHPSFAEVVNRATSVMCIPVWFCRYWYDQVGPKGANWVGKDNCSIDRRSYARNLNSWYRNAKTKGELDGIRREYDKSFASSGSSFGAGESSTASLGYDTDTSHWVECSKLCYWIYECGYGCEHAKTPPKNCAKCPHFKPKK